MDYVLHYADEYAFNYIYPESIPVDNIFRQCISMFTLTTLGGAFTYLLPATILYYTIFDRRLELHDKYLPNQRWLEIKYAMWSVPYMAIPTAAVFVAEINGFSKLYDNIDDHPLGIWFMLITVVTFILFTDFGIYWIHRWLHLPIFYGRFHKPHHKWLICTPYASHAFHPVDGFAQSFPYHLYIFLFPMHKWLYLGLFLFVNTWSTLIHDEVYWVPDFLREIVNGSAHHTDHHLFFNYNYGQYFTLWDRIGGSFRNPSGFEEGASVYDDLKRQGVITDASSSETDAALVSKKSEDTVESSMGTSDSEKMLLATSTEVSDDKQNVLSIEKEEKEKESEDSTGPIRRVLAA